MWPDYINGAFELLGAIAVFSNVFRIRKDKIVRGVNWQTYLFFLSWGLWNLFYYPSLDQWASFVGGLAIVVGNVLWLSHVWYYHDRESN